MHRSAYLAAVALAAPIPTFAQTVDYSALQAVIGEPVTTSVTGKPLRGSELPSSTIIITAEQVARSPARDVPGLLKSYAGIDVNRWTAGQSDVAVRGGVQTYNARLLVLVDGRQVYLDHYGMTDWNLLSVANEDIQQIELVRGPASALFGFNAASGVVNIVTRRPGTTPTLRATASAGSHGWNRIAGSLYLPVSDSVGAKITAGRQREDERATPAAIVGRQRFDVEADHVATELNGRIDATMLTVGGGYAVNRQLEFLPTQLLSNQLYKSGNVHANVTHDTEWGGLTLNGFVNWLDAHYGTDGSIGGVTRSLKLANRIVNVKASSLYRFHGDDALRLGVEYRNNRLISDAQYSRGIVYDVASANAIFDLNPTDRVTTTAAVRLDHLWLHQFGAIAQPAVNAPRDYAREFNRISFNASLLWRTSDDGMLRINGGRGYQLPSLVIYGFRLEVPVPPPFTVIVAGSPTIRPVSTWSAEIGYSHQRGGLRGEATTFYTRTTGTIAPPTEGSIDRAELIFTPGPTIVERYYSAGNYVTYGTELSVSGRHEAISWRANYTWTHTRGTFGAFDPAAPVPLSPRITTPVHKANLEVGYDAGDRWSLTGLARYTSATRQFAFAPAVSVTKVQLFDVDPSIALDTRIGLHLSERVEVFAAGENLSLARGAAVSPIPADRRIRGGLRVTL